MRTRIKAKEFEIQKARLERGLSQIAMARALEIHNKHLSLIETGKVALGPELANRICRFLGKQFSDIFLVTDLSGEKDLVSDRKASLDVTRGP